MLISMHLMIWMRIVLFFPWSLFFDVAENVFYLFRFKCEAFFSSFAALLNEVYQTIIVRINSS